MNLHLRVLDPKSPHHPHPHMPASHEDPRSNHGLMTLHSRVPSPYEDPQVISKHMSLRKTLHRVHIRCRYRTTVSSYLVLVIL